MAALVAAAVCVLPTSAGAASPDFTWRVADRLDPSLPSGGAHTPDDVAVSDLPIVVQVAPAACRPGATYRVSVDASVVSRAAGSTCAFEVRGRPGPHRLAVRGPDGTLASRDVVVDDRLVV